MVTAAVLGVGADLATRGTDHSHTSEPIWMGQEQVGIEDRATAETTRTFSTVRIEDRVDIRSGQEGPTLAWVDTTATGHKYKDVEGSVGLGSAGASWTYSFTPATPGRERHDETRVSHQGDEVLTLDREARDTDLGTVQTLTSVGLGGDWQAAAHLSPEGVSSCSVNLGTGLNYQVTLEGDQYGLHLPAQEPIRLSTGPSGSHFESGGQPLTDFGVQRDVVDLISACRLNDTELDQLDRNQDRAQVARLGAGGAGLSEAAFWRSLSHSMLIRSTVPSSV